MRTDYKHTAIRQDTHNSEQGSFSTHDHGFTQHLVGVKLGKKMDFEIQAWRQISREAIEAAWPLIAAQLATEKPRRTRHLTLMPDIFYICPPQTETFKATEMVYIISPLNAKRHTERNLCHAYLALNHFTHIIIRAGCDLCAFMSHICHISSSAGVPLGSGPI